MENILTNEEIYDQKESLEDEYVSLFTLAKKEYDNIVKYLKENVFKVYNEGEEFRGNVEYHTDYNLKYFDILLQYSILQMALLDGKLIDQRIETIEGIAFHGSLPHIIEEKVPHFHWTSFTDIKPEEVFVALDSIRDSIGDIIKEFSQRLEMHKYVSGDTFDSFYPAVKHFLEVVMAYSGEFKEIGENDQCLILEIIRPKYDYVEEVYESK